MADNTIQSATDGNFEAEVLTASNSQPVMVDFWAEWCRPCHMLAPTVAEIAHDYAGKLKVMKLNVDEAMNSAGRYRVQGIPTLLLFKNGQGVEQIVGAVPKDQITKALDRHLAQVEFENLRRRVVKLRAARLFVCAGRKFRLECLGEIGMKKPGSKTVRCGWAGNELNIPYHDE